MAYPAPVVDDTDPFKKKKPASPYATTNAATDTPALPKPPGTPDATTNETPPPPAPPAAPPPPPTPPPPPPPTTPDPFLAMGGGVWTGQQWVPRDHPLAKPFVNTATTPPNPPPPGDAIPIEGPSPIAPPESPIVPPLAPPTTGTVIPPSVAPPTTPDPFQAMGGGVWTGQQWVPRNHPLAQPWLSGTPPGGAPGAPAAPGVPGTPTVPSTPDFDARIREAILRRLGQSENPDINDPVMQQQLNARRTANQRTTENQRRILAERAAAEGTGVTEGSFQADINGLNQQEGENYAQFQSDLLAQQQAKRAADIQDALRIGASTLSQDEQQKLQRELALIEKGLRERGYNIQESLGNQDLSLRKYLGEGGLSLGFLQSLLGRTNFLDQLGLSYADLQALLNNQAISKVL